MTVRVLLVSPGSHRHGGAERCLVGLLEGFRGVAIDPRVVVFGEGTLVDLLRELGVPVAVIPVQNRVPAARYRSGIGLVSSMLAAAPGVPRAISRIRVEARRFGASIVHTNGARAHALLPFLRSSHAPCVASVHDVPVTGIERRITAVVLGAADAVIANSPTVARPYEGSSVTCQVIDNPVGVPAERPRAAALHRFGLPDDAFVVGSLGHFHWYKGQLDLVHAMGSLDRRSHLLLGGGQLYGAPSLEYFRQISAAAAASPAAERIHVIGVQDDVSWVYAASDVVAHCSVRPEPFGMVIAEALLTGTAVVSTTAGNPGEMLDDGRTAMLYPPGDRDRLGRCLAALAADPGKRAELGRAGRAWAGDRFAPERHARSVLAIYEAVLAARRVPQKPPIAPGRL